MIVLKIDINSLDYLDRYSGILKFGVSTYLHDLEFPQNLSLAFDIVVKTKGTQFLATYVDKTFLNSRKTGKRAVFIFKKKTGNEYVKIDPASIEKIEFKDPLHDDCRISLEDLTCYVKELIDSKDDYIRVETSYVDPSSLTDDNVPMSLEDQHKYESEITYTEKNPFKEGKYEIEIGLYSDFIENFNEKICWKDQFNKPLGFAFYVGALKDLISKKK